MNLIIPGLIRIQPNPIIVGFRALWDTGFRRYRVRTVCPPNY